MVIKEYKPARGVDYDSVLFENGEKLYFWYKSPFRSTDYALFEMASNDGEDLGRVRIERDYESREKQWIYVRFEKKGWETKFPITFKQWVRPSKKSMVLKMARYYYLKEQELLENK